MFPFFFLNPQIFFFTFPDLINLFQTSLKCRRQERFASKGLANYSDMESGFEKSIIFYIFGSVMQILSYSKLYPNIQPTPNKVHYNIGVSKPSFPVPDMTHCLFLYIKFYWNTTTLMFCLWMLYLDLNKRLCIMAIFKFIFLYHCMTNPCGREEGIYDHFYCIVLSVLVQLYSFLLLVAHNLISFMKHMIH